VLVRAFTGRNSFDDAPQLDERGAWLSACVPLADHTGRITAVLRVDYDARAWTMSMFRARGGALGFCGILVAILVGTSSTVTLLRGELVRRCRAEQALRESESRLRELALHDRLTGLPNRALLKDRLEQAVIRATRHPEYRFALLFLDFDRFKLVNDSLGHGTGDELLREISARVCRTLRRGDSISRGTDSSGAEHPAESQDLAARLGGDEFVILLDAIRSPANAALVAQRLLEVLGKPYVIAGHEIHISASIGITVSDARYTNADDMMRDADTAMYHAKDAGGARYTLFDPRMHEMAVNRLTAENDLRRAIQQGHLRLVYQPIVRVEDRRLVGFEALVRWDHPTRGTIEPGEFIPLAEESGLIAPLGAWVLGEACRTLKRWRDQFEPARTLTMSVNISRRQFELAGLVEGVCRTLNETSIDPTRLILEITESVLMRDTGSAAALLGQLRALGVKVVMDDFGTGHSSLSCLHRFGLNGLKIDRSLIANASGHREYAAVVSAVIMLARNLNMTLVAEGVETDDHLTLLQGMDCDLAQGYYFSVPLSETDAAGWIAAAVPMAATR
jgi:predicted signal transduction protein with EAL and GGDEF domain